MRIDIITLFPDMFRGPFDESMIKKAQEKKLASVNIHNLRDWGIDKRATVDSHPYGGGPGMLLRPEPIFNAVSDIKRLKDQKIKRSKVVLLDAGGIKFNQKKAEEYSKLGQLILICGHYEGVDYRVHKYLADEVISIGDFVLTGGELPSMLVTDSVVRLIPRVLNKEKATDSESFSNKLTTHHSSLETPSVQSLVEYPQYTRPENYNNHKVPEILLSGNHVEIEKWREKQAINRTKKNRPDLIQ